MPRGPNCHGPTWYLVGQGTGPSHGNPPHPFMWPAIRPGKGLWATSGGSRAFHSTGLGCKLPTPYSVLLGCFEILALLPSL